MFKINRIKEKIKNSKTTKYVVEHKKEIISLCAYYAACGLAGYALGSFINSMINRKIKVELDLRNVAYNTASTKVVGKEKAYDICIEAKKISDTLDKNLKGIRYKDLELMLKRGIVPSNNLIELKQVHK